MHVRVLNVFLSSPRDVAEERRLAVKVIDRLNRLDHIRRRFLVRACDYEHDAPPLIGRPPQQVVDEYVLDAGQADIFVCVLWGRMGTPLVCPRTKQVYQSGTEYEFTHAFEANQASGTPHMLLYRCVRPLPPDADPDQVRRVEEFFRDIERPGGRFVGLTNTRHETPQEFAEQLHEHLLNLLERHYVGASGAAPRVGSDALPLQGAARVPCPDTPMIDRERERAELHRLLIDREAGLVTIRGTGGIGKTRLACETARALAEHFPGGSVYAELKERESAERIAYAVAYALGRAAQLSQDRPPVEQVAELLTRLPSTLLVLNNLEPVPGLAAETLGPWRQAAPQVRLLVTSRAGAPVEGAHSLRLSGLAYPTGADRSSGWVERLAADESVQLFVETAARDRSSAGQRFELNEENAADVEQLCHTLQGQPLPIILVARLASFTTPAELVEELRHRFHDVQVDGLSLRETIAWTFSRLAPYQQEVFRQACVFRDGFTPRAAEQVIRAELPPRVRLVDVLRQLCDMSLLESTPHGRETRYWMYQTIQDFGCESWARPSHPPEDLARRWADYFAGFAAEQAVRVITKDGLDALERLSRDRENILAVHQWALETGKPALAARVILGCARALAVRAPWQLRRGRLIDTLEALRDEEPAARVRLLIELADSYWGVGDYTHASRLAAKACELAETLGDDRLQAAALLARAHTANDVGDRESALRDYAAGGRLAERVGDVPVQAWCLMGISYIHDRQGRPAEARQAADRAVALVRERGDDFDLARAVNNRGLVLWHWGDPAAALECFREAEVLERRFGNLRLAAGRITNQGLALADLDRLEEALKRFAEADSLHADQGSRAFQAVNAAGWGATLLLAGRAAEAADFLGRTLPEAEATGYTENVALVAGSLGRALLALGRPEEAAGHLRRALALQRDMDRGRNRRYWGNLIRLAQAERQSGHAEAARPLVEEATRLGVELGVQADDPVRLIREDEAARRELQTWLEGGAA
jgi:predicted ATPase